MIKTHEVKLFGSAFDKFSEIDYIILESLDMKKDDFILFKQVETVENLTTETGLHRMTKVKTIINDIGLKDGYSLFIVTKL